MTDNSRVRVSIVGVVIVALFSALLARLWFLQVGADPQVKVEAVSRSTRVVQTQMPRGQILDRNGVPLVVNEATWAITVDRRLDEATRTVVLGQLAELLGVESAQLAENFDDIRQSQLKPAIVAVGVEENVRVAIQEHAEDYPGIDVERLTVRHYPQGNVAAHLLGYVGEISAEQLEARRDEGYQESDEIGRAGVERAYESELRGEPRRETMEVDPTGRPVGSPIDVEPGRVGNDVYLTIDVNWQRAAEDSLAQGIEEARRLQNKNIEDHYELLQAPAGSVVVLDVRDGSVAAMASFPTYDPATLVDGISQVEWDALNDPVLHRPLLNRATQGEYAPGSTFKLITGTAITRYGLWTPGTTIRDPGYLEVGDRRFRNFGGIAHGRVALERALTVSSDVYFYTAGYDFWKHWDEGLPDGLAIQETARDYGFGANTGIEVDEQDGLVADPEWKRDLSYRINEGDAREDNAQWRPGDNVNVSVGQGGMLVTPLQLANAYAAFANGGTLWQPHLAREVRNADAEVVRTIEPNAYRTIAIDAPTRAAMQAGFVGAVRDDRGTAAGAFAGFPLDTLSVAGKTGTAQVNDKGDTSLFASYFPADAPQYVVVAVVEEGGQGSQIAAPIVRRIIEAMNGLELNDVEANEDGID